jgi:hypothetical protein
MPDVAKEIRTKLDAFVHDLEGLVRRAALEAVREALGAASAPPVARKRGRPAKAVAAPVPAPKGRPAKKVAVVTRHAGQKRDPAELEKLVERLASHIKAHPGQRIEQINKVLGVPTKDLALPIKKLLGSKRISSKGQKRSTTYHT